MVFVFTRSLDGLALDCSEGVVIICSCNVISEEDLVEGIALLRANNPHRTPTVGSIYRALGKRVNCKGCIPLTMRIVQELRSSQNNPELEPQHVVPGKEIAA